MWQYNYSPELYHYGVIGMRWGHRKQKPYNKMSASQKQRYLENQYYKKTSNIYREARDQKNAVRADARKQIKKINSNRFDRAFQVESTYYKNMGKIQSNKKAVGKIVGKTALAAVGTFGVGLVGLAVLKKTGSVAAANAIANIGGAGVAGTLGYSAGRDVVGIIGNRVYHNNNKKKK